MSSKQLTEALERFYNKIHTVLDELPEKAMAKKHRQKLDGITQAFREVVSCWDEMKMDVATSEEEKKVLGQKDAEVFSPIFGASIKHLEENVISFFEDRWSISMHELEWSDELFTNVVELHISRKIESMIDDGATREEIRNYAQEELISAARSLSSSTSSARNLVTECRAKSWALQLCKL